MSAVHIQTRSVDQDICQTLIQSGADPLTARLCASRGVVSPAELDDKLAALLPYQTLTHCETAAARLADAIGRKEKILIVADYDADGATACSVGMAGLGALGAAVDFLVPNRFEHGYGLTPELADIAAAQGVNLLVTVDNGIASIAGVARAQALGIDVIVTDHHLPADEVPNCIIVNPNQRGCGFASKSLAGVGVIFYVLMACRIAAARIFFRRPQRAESGRFARFGGTGHGGRRSIARSQQPHSRFAGFETDAFGQDAPGHPRPV